MPATTALVATVISTRFGDVSFFATANDGIVRASGFGPIERIATSYLNAWGEREWVLGDHPDVADALAAWEDGEIDALTRVAGIQPGGEFRQRAWAAMTAIPGGRVLTYGELAEQAGSPRAARAAGQACATNALAPFVPCHRVLASSGLGNYGFGIDLKRQLLVHEGAIEGSGG